MTDTAFFIATASSAIATSLRTNVETSLAKARRETLSVLSADAILTTNVDAVFVDATGGVTISMPPSPTSGDNFRIQKYDGTAGVLTISGNGNLINGTATVSASSQWAGWQLTYSDTGSVAWAGFLF